MGWILDRLTEKSTWAGLALIADAVGRWFAGDKVAAVEAVCGAVVVAVREAQK